MGILDRFNAWCDNVDQRTADKLIQEKEQELADLRAQRDAIQAKALNRKHRRLARETKGA